MEASRVEWPTLRMADPNAPGNVTRNLQQRIRDHHQDSNDILQYAQDNQGSLPDEAVKVIERWRDLTQNLLDWMGAKQELRDITGDIKCDDYALTTETEPPRLEKYVQACKAAPPPAYYQSSYSSGSSPPASPSNLAQDREIAVKMWDPYVASQYRCLTPADITSQAEKARKSTARRDGGATLASIQFVAAKHLRSGDLSLTLRSAQEADIARTHRRWVKIFESDSVIDLPLWGVVVHDMPVKWVGGLSTPAARQRVINDLVAANTSTWGENVDVLQVRWLRGPAPGTESSAMVVKFTHPEAANCTVLYDRPPCIRRCFSCEQFGHLSSICPNESTRCFCAEHHDIRDCPRRTETGDRVHKCANCGGPHAAASKNCSYYAEQKKKVQDWTTYRQRYYRIPIYMQGLENSEDGASSSATSCSCSDSEKHNSASWNQRVIWERRPPRNRGPNQRGPQKLPLVNRLQRVWRAPLPAWLRLTQALLELSPYQPDSRHLQSPSAGRRSSGSLLVTQESRPPPAHRRHLSGPKPQARLPLICLTQDVVRVWPDRQRKPTQFHKERRG
ncbi:hypothetical protein AO1008_00495 [Aspergillus oryzae 100-8]|nr:hypothetical protein AO1008_00495 [Aspergillus oryzae 100-8]